MQLKNLYQSGRPVISCEVFPPKKDTDIANIYQALEHICALAPDFISVTYGAGGSGNINSTAEIAAHIQQTHAIPALAHLTCVGANPAQIDRLLTDMRQKGIDNVLALRGDLPDGEAPVDALANASALIGRIRAQGGFSIGGACYPEGHIDCPTLEQDIRHLREKQDAGADFLITQLFFDNDHFFRFLDRARAAGVTLPVSAGVMPILGRSQIERMIFLCGVSLPSEIIKLLHKHQHNLADLQKAGVEHAARQMEDLIRRGAQGVHIYTMNKPEIAATCMGRLRVL
jgi:5,10-methylenetetrahydrofolate reductase, prokaryotic form